MEEFDKWYKTAFIGECTSDDPHTSEVNTMMHCVCFSLSSKPCRQQRKRVRQSLALVRMRWTRFEANSPSQ